MKKTKKLSFLLMLAAAFVLLFAMQVTAYAEVYKGGCGLGVNWEVDTQTKTLTIKGQGDMKDYGHMGNDSSPYKAYKKDIQKIVVEDGITSIGDYAFYDLYNVKEAVLGKDVISIGTCGFFYCGKMETISLPESLEIVGDGAFWNCGSLKNVVLPKNVDTIGEEAFWCCSNLVSVTIPDGVTSIGASAFRQCDDLEKVVIPPSVQYIGDCIFADAESLVSVQLPEGLTSIPYYAFNGCNALICVNIPSTVKTIGERAFFECNSLKGVRLPEALEIIEAYAFAKTKIEHLLIPERVLSIGDMAFYDCKNLQKIAILSPDTKLYNGKKTLGVVGVTTIYGKENSTAAAHALAYDYAFTYIAEDNLWVDSMEYPNPFSDVKEGYFYCDPVKWAVYHGITAGVTATAFRPDDPCTRGQIVTFLWRTENKPAPTLDGNPFEDVRNNQFYYNAVLWAVEHNITAGLTSVQFGPEAPCTRGQIVTFLWRKEGQPKASSSEHTFKDIKEGQYYYDAVLWAVEQGVTAGLTPELFGPEEPCTRGQIVTFLSRVYQ